MRKNQVVCRSIDEATKIAIFSHVHPDADALCSSLALKKIIQNNFEGKFVDVFVGGEIAKLYDPVLRDQVVNPQPYRNYDLAIVLDCPSLARLGEFEELAASIPQIINIDHHATNERFGTCNIVSPAVSSTCELVALIAFAQQLQLSNTCAKELYQGIITDTNCFTSMSITPRTHHVVSELLKYEFNADAIKKYYFQNNSPAKTKLLTGALQSLKFYKNAQFTTMKIDNVTYQNAQASFVDTLGIIDNGVNISNAQVGAILIESKPGYIYCSLRSKGDVNVGEIAKQFNGGGSATMAAFQTTGNIRSVEQQLVDVTKPLLPEDVDDDELLLF